MDCSPRRPLLFIALIGVILCARGAFAQEVPATAAEPAPAAAATQPEPPASPSSPTNLEPVVGAGNRTESSGPGPAPGEPGGPQIPVAVPVDRTIRLLRQEPPVVSLRALEGLDPKSLRLVVSLEEQRAWLYSGETVVIQTPVSTGRRAHPTPRGSFKVATLEAERQDKNFGDFVDPGGRVIRASIDSRYDYAPAGSRFQATPKQHFIEFSPETGLGFRAGDPPGYRATRGDVLIPRRVAALLFSAVEVGTPVEIQP